MTKRRLVDVPALRARIAATAWATMLQRLQLRTGKKNATDAERILFCCPAHRDENPSASTARDNGDPVWHCIVCDAGGSLFHLIAAQHGLHVERDFPRIAEIANDVVGGGQMPTTSIAAPKHEPPPKASPPPRASLDLMGELSHVLLPLDHEHATPAVVAYLQQRKLLALAIGEDWRALSTPDVLYQLEERLGIGGDPAESDLARADLVQLGDDGWRLSWPGNLLAITWRTRGGMVDTIQRRRLDGQKANKYVFAAGRRPLWPYGIERFDASPGTSELVLVEGAIDTIARRALDTAGRVVLGLPGTSGWRDEWADLVRGRVVRLAFDADKAGDEAASKLAPTLHTAGATRVIRERSEGQDWAERLASS